jgi:hypothetical protein
MPQRATAWLCWLPRRSGAGVVIVGASGQTMRTRVVLVSGSINSMLGASPLLLSDQCAPPRPLRLLERRNFQDRRCGWTRLPTTARLAADLPSGRSTRPEALAVCQRRGAGVPVRRLDSRSVMTHLGGTRCRTRFWEFFWLLIGSFSFAAYLMVLFQVIADLFGIVDFVALAGLFNSFRMMRLPEPPASDRLRETTLT